MSFTQKQQQTIENNFGYLGDRAYFSSSFVAPAPKLVADLMPEYFRQFTERLQGDRWLDYAEAQQEAARKELAQLIHAQPETIAFTKNTTEGLGIIATGYPWQAGKNIVIPRQEHKANLLNWIRLQQHGVTLKYVDAPVTGLDAQSIIDAIDADTQAVVMSLVEYQDGAMPDVARIGSACHDRHVLLIVDAIQAVGRMVVDVAAMHIDWLACGGHKGLLAMDSGGFLYCTPALWSKVTPPIIGFESFSHFDDKQVTLRSDARRFQNGSVNVLGLLTMAHTARFLNDLTPVAIQAHIRGLERRLLTQAALQNITLGIYGDQLSGVFLYEFTSDAKSRIVQALADAKIDASIRDNNVRFCISFFNTAAQVDRLVTCLASISPA